MAPSLKARPVDRVLIFSLIPGELRGQGRHTAILGNFGGWLRSP